MALPIIPLAAAGIQAGAGAIQALVGRKRLKNLSRPTYEIPEEVKKNLSESELQALEGMPAEQKQEYIKNIERGVQTGLQQLGSRKAGLAGLGNIVQAQSDAYSNLVSMDAAARQQNRMIAQQQRQNMADYKDKSFSINKFEPYQQKLEEGQALVGAGLQNVFGALGTAATAGMFAEGGTKGGMNGGTIGEDGDNYQKYLQNPKFMELLMKGAAKSNKNI